MFRLVLVIFIVIFSIAQINSEIVIDNFKTSDNISSWYEYSDTMYPGGKSKASLVIKKTNNKFQKAVLFTLLNPVSSGAALAGIAKNVSLDLTGSESILLNIKNKGQHAGYQVFLRHRGIFGNNVPSYVAYFTAPKTKLQVISLPLSEFTAVFHGKPLKDAEPLDISNVTQIGLLAYGGKLKQKGVAALEIEYIKIV